MIVTVNCSSLQALPLSRVIGLPYPRRSITTNLNLKMILPIYKVVFIINYIYYKSSVIGEMLQKVPINRIIVFSGEW